VCGHCLWITFIKKFYSNETSYDRSVNIATRLRTGRPRFDSRQRKEVLFFATASKPALGPTQYSFQCVLGSLSPGVKLSGREADHSLPCSAQVRTCTAIHSLPHMSSQRGVQSRSRYIFKARYLLKLRDSLIFICFYATEIKAGHVSEEVLKS
jgi:hypothetical protein